MSKFLVALGALGALAVGTAAATAVVPVGTGGVVAPEPSVSCELKVSRTAGIVHLEAWARASRPAAGEYQLSVTKVGPSGSSDVSQGGEFAVGADSNAVLSSTEFGLEPGAKLRARLTLSDRHGQLCEHEVAS